MSELKPCPFCGFEAELHMESQACFWVECLFCHVALQSRGGKPGAIAAWNHRPLEAELVAVLEGFVENGRTPGTWVAAKDALAKVRGLEART